MNIDARRMELREEGLDTNAINAKIFSELLKERGYLVRDYDNWYDSSRDEYRPVEEGWHDFAGFVWRQLCDYDFDNLDKASAMTLGELVTVFAQVKGKGWRNPVR